MLLFADAPLLANAKRMFALLPADSSFRVQLNFVRAKNMNRFSRRINMNLNSGDSVSVSRPSELREVIGWLSILIS